ncbi:hypothetical protein NDU88_004092 [Pleurodeles waltl]|uniref:Uncharacterized protein n=1 Tax=Pleurodeles waltl TaxID=8319 RepID=A0AAV7NK25_PLEWA|nr:hypothetical protein NDU88_004092 [Pleurodeles waltl]
MMCTENMCTEKCAQRTTEEGCTGLVDTAFEDVHLRGIEAGWMERQIRDEMQKKGQQETEEADTSDHGGQQTKSVSGRSQETIDPMERETSWRTQRQSHPSRDVALAGTGQHTQP